MIYPLLNSTLHLHLHQPVYIIRSSLIIRRLGNQLIDFLLCITLCCIIAVNIHPFQEFTMVYDILFVTVTHFIYKINMNILIIRIYFATTLIDRHKDWFNTTGSLRHQRCCPGRGNRKTGNISTTIFCHILIKLGISFFNTENERVLLLTLGIINFEGSTLFSHRNRASICIQSQCLMNRYSKISSFLSTIAQSHCSNHIPFSRNTDTGTTPQSTLLFNLLPKMTFSSLYLLILRIIANLIQNQINLFHFQINDIIHDTLSQLSMFKEELIVKSCFLGERMIYV